MLLDFRPLVVHEIPPVLALSFRSGLRRLRDYYALC
jgi:hypothetical protein